MQHHVLLIALVRLAKCMSEGPVEVEHTRCFHQHGQLPYQGKRNRCHPACFNFTCEQSHGPRTDRSGGDQDHQIDSCLGKQFPNLASECKEITRVLDEAKAVVNICYPTNDTCRL